MKQAIEEGYILDVLQNFTEYDTMFKLNKEINLETVEKFVCVEDILKAAGL